MSETVVAGPIRALVCEDEPLARRAIRQYLKGVDWIELVGEAVNGSEATRLLHKLEPDLVFMDVRMPGSSGLEVLDSAMHVPAVVFTTAHDEYAVRAFELGAVDYLVKPFGRERLLETLQRVRVRLRGEGLRANAKGPEPGRFLRRIFARAGGAIVPVAVERVVRIETSQGGATLVTVDGPFEVDITLGALAERLDPEHFVRVHRSHVVNLSQVTSIRRYDERRLQVRLADNSMVVASRHGSQALRGLMG